MSPAIVAAEALGMMILVILTMVHLLDVRSRRHGLLEAAGPGVGVTPKVTGKWDRWVRRTKFGRKLGDRVEGAGLTWPVGTVLTTVFGIMIVFSAISFPLLGKLGPVLVAVVVWIGLQKWLKRRQTQRVDQFVAQLPELSRLLANGASAGLAVRRSLDLASREMVEPAGSELGRVVAELDVGATLSQAMTKLGERLPSRELNVLVQTLIIQARSGGELVTALTHIADTLDERKQLRREVRTASAGSAFSGGAVLVMGLGSVVLMNVMSPGALDTMISSPLGIVVLAVAGAFFAIGATLMARISKVEI